MPSKKKPLPLHVSRALIEAERANVLLRTQRRIAILRASEDQRKNQDDEDPVTLRIVHCTLPYLPKHVLFLCHVGYCELTLFTVALPFTTRYIILNNYNPFVYICQ